MEEHRILKVKDVTDGESGSYVLYWMQSAQRIGDNHALEWAIQLANHYQKPLLIGFVIMPDYPSGNLRHFEFMLQGLETLVPKLCELGAGFKYFIGWDKDFILTASEAIAVVMDRSYTRFPRLIKEKICQIIDTKIYEVDTNVIVPLHEAYEKEAYAAYAIRPALHRKMNTFLSPVVLPKLHHRYELESDKFDANKIVTEDLCHLPILEPTPFRGGETEGLQQLDVFMNQKLKHYAESSNDPSKAMTSCLSPYLHFGQLSPVTVINRLNQRDLNIDAFVEQLFVRRELAYNFVYFNPNYDVSLDKILPSWALETLEKHRSDKRPALYTLNQLEKAQTEDLFWNAAQMQMVQTGYMHNYMRMYWGKKIIEWSETPEIAFQEMLYLNDKYLLDGRDPNGYAGIAWCFGKHDRAFKERDVFGKIRFMSATGLKRKFNMEGYLKKYL